jgi:hypothetical protein
MKLLCREVLADCALAKTQFDAAIAEKDFRKARVSWLLNLTLLRAVGHVLKSESEAIGGSFEAKVQSHFRQWSGDAIFAEFIKKERDGVLKEYVHTIERTLRSEEVSLVTSAGFALVTDTGQELIGVVGIEDIVKTDGYGANTPPSELLGVAIDWWKQKLDELDRPD